MLLLLACWLYVVPFGLCDSAQDQHLDLRTWPVQDVPAWATDATLQLTLTTSGDANPLQYTVIPLTAAVGLNESQTALRTINIIGNLIAADASNYHMINDTEDVAYLSCDENNGPMSANDIFRKLIVVKPRAIRAILLYTTTRNWCEIDYITGNLPYGSILTMADAAEAGKALSYLNDTDNGEIVKASIYGNVTENPSSVGGNNGQSSAAMTALYCITAIVALMFVSILLIGFIRAQRNPRQYGPHHGDDARPRQSRARGIARAIVDTIPIVQFRGPSDPKQDPELELNKVATNGQDATPQRTSADVDEDRSKVPVDSTTKPVDSSDRQSHSQKSLAELSTDADNQSACSICHDDFTIGEDVRVLPCTHQFHPACIDPWLINVSGTCPLCRFVLHSPVQDDTIGARVARQTSRSRRSTTSARYEQTGSDLPLAPPLGSDVESASISSRSRLPRILDINRLRNAPVEERMAALRQLRAQQPSEALHSGDGEERRQRARFTERLRDTFRVRTRAQLPQEGSQA